MEYLTVSEAAEALQLSVPTIKRYIYEGKLKSSKLPGGQHRISREAIDQLLSPGDDGVDGDRSGSTPGVEDRLDVLERWMTELQSDIERMSATLEVLSRYCERAMGAEADAGESVPGVLILGPGCRRCDDLYALVTRVLQSMGHSDIALERVKNLDDITAYGPVVTPALVIDGKVVLSGRIPTEKALRQLLGQHLG